MFELLPMLQGAARQHLAHPAIQHMQKRDTVASTSTPTTEGTSASTGQSLAASKLSTEMPAESSTLSATTDQSVATSALPTELSSTTAASSELRASLSYHSAASLLDVSSSLVSSTSETTNDLVTVYTRDSLGRKPTIQLIVPTITTNSLPSEYTLATNLSASSTHSISHQAKSSRKQTAISDLYSTLYASSIIPTHTQSLSSKKSVISIAADRSSTLSTSPSSSVASSSSSSSWPLLSFLPYSASASSSAFSSSTSSSSSSSLSSWSSSSSKGTTTITEYLEEITYTQVYVVTDSKTTLTTSLLATTTFYVDSLTTTYSISPAAITTDLQSLKSRLDLKGLFSKKLSGGSIAGIAIGSVLGFLLICLCFFFFLRKRKYKGKEFWTFHKSRRQDDEYDEEYDSYTHNDRAPLNPVLDLSRDVEEIDEENMTPRNRYFSFQLSTPPIPNRSNKPIINEIRSPGSINAESKDVSKNSLVSHHASSKSDCSSTSNETNHSEESDMGLFDMKSTLNSIHASTDKVQLLMPPLPPPRKSKGINRIDKMNYTADPDSDVIDLSIKSPSTPLKNLPVDRTMGVLYESPNEQCIWDEFESARNLGLMNNSESGDSDYVDSPTDSEFRSADKSHKSHYMQQLNSNGEYGSDPRTTIMRLPNRVRSGSGATRYESLANNLNTFKHELEKERSLSSPLRESYDVDREEEEKNKKEGNGQLKEQIHNDLVDNYLKSESHLGTITILPPPVPKPRKNV